MAFHHAQTLALPSVREKHDIEAGGLGLACPAVEAGWRERCRPFSPDHGRAWAHDRFGAQVRVRDKNLSSAGSSPKAKIRTLSLEPAELQRGFAHLACQP